MKTSATGVVHGRTIELDKAISPPLDGRKVRVVVESDDESVELSPTEQREAWASWVAQGEQGPIEDDGEPEFP